MKGKRQQYTLATKFGLVPHADGKGADVDGSPQHVRAACEASLKRLQTDYIDLYYQHRVDRKVGIETTVREMKVIMNATSQMQLGCSIIDLTMSTLLSRELTLQLHCSHALLAKVPPCNVCTQGNGHTP